jgi:hypothetical protein
MESPCKHLKQVDFTQFIERGLEGCTWGPLERHLTQCSECLQMLGKLLQAVAPQMAEQAAIDTISQPPCSNSRGSR